MNLFGIDLRLTRVLAALIFPLLHGATAQFFIPPIYNIGAKSNASTAGDLNGDGVPDVVLANNCSTYCGYGLAIFLSNGKGGYSFQQPLAGGIAASSIVIADFNNDGKADIAVANRGDTTHAPNLVVYLGHGDGTFQFPVGVVLSFVPVAMASGDLNKDGNADIVITSSNGIQALIGMGNGKFQHPVAYGAGSAFGAIVMGDFNGDHALDIAAIGYSCSCVAVLLNQGSGTFGTASFQPESATGSLIAADFNHDGILDLAISSKQPAPPNTFALANIQIALGDGAGNFTSANSAAQGGGSDSLQGMVTADFNGDGFMDLAAASAGTIEINYGDGAGGFLSTAYYQSSAYPSPLAAADLNRDGKLDLVVSTDCNDTFCNSSGLSILYGAGKGTFIAPAQFPDDAGPYGYSTMASADFNRDGKPDIAVSAPKPGRYYSEGISLMIANGNGKFTLQQPGLVTPGTPQALAAGDFNGDGNADIVVESGAGAIPASNINVFLGNGDGSFQPIATTRVPFVAQQFRVADFNRDGKEDLLVLSADGNAHILLSVGNGKFVASGILTATDAAVGDINGDGYLDIVVSSAATTQILFGTKSGVYQAPKSFPALSGRLLLADVNGDGRLDMVGCTGDISVMLNLGGGTFGPAVSTSLTNFAFTANCALADVNGDGKLDVIRPGQNGFWYALGKGDGTFQKVIDYESSADQSGAIIVEDLNGDNAPDVILAQSGFLTVIFNTGAR